MSAKIALQKALLLLDRGNLERGEALLREAIDDSEQERDDLTLVGALCCLGDLLHSEGRSQEAVPFLERVLTFRREDDLIDYERERADEILAGIKSGNS